jgi:hypothetical protein
MNRSALLDPRQHRRDVCLQQASDLWVLRFSDGFDAVLSRDNLSVDFRSVREQLVKQLHVCSVFSIAHHASTSTDALSERWRDDDQSDEQHLYERGRVKLSSHELLLPQADPYTLGVSPS